MKIEEQIKIIEFADFGDERGNLVVIEGDGMDIPFDIKRVFYIYGSDSEVVRGSSEEMIVELNKPRMGLYLPSMLWKDMYDFSADSVLLVLASRHYDGNEYIRDYEEYLREIQ